MVFIYGGTYIHGSSSELIYGPEMLLEKDVIVVTFNYRTGVLGMKCIELTAFVFAV